MGEHRLEVLRVDPGIGTIPLSGVDVPSSSQGVRLSTKFAKVKVDNQVKLAEEFRPAGLLLG